MRCTPHCPSDCWGDPRPMTENNAVVKQEIFTSREPQSTFRLYLKSQQYELAPPLTKHRRNKRKEKNQKRYSRLWESRAKNWTLLNQREQGILKVYLYTGSSSTINHSQPELIYISNLLSHRTPPQSCFWDPTRPQYALVCLLFLQSQHIYTTRDEV